MSAGSFGVGPNRGRTIEAQWPNATLENFFEYASEDGAQLDAWCYTDQLSYAPGDSVHIHTSTTGRTYDLTIYRDGKNKTVVYEESGIAGRRHPTPRDCSVKGCGWPVARDVPVSPAWRSGGYVLEITAHGADDASFTHHFPFIVRAIAPTSPDAVLLVACTGTWVAYNDWGGSNLYEGIEGPDLNQPARSVSTLRPFSRGFAWLPDGAPRIPFTKPPKQGAALRYPHMEWAYANGFSKKYASAGWASYERHFLRWAEDAGFVVDVATQHDLELHPEILSKYKCIAIVGHDEYWSGPMRDAVDAYVEAGGHIARFAGNFGWQIRLGNGGTEVICYKAAAHSEDPVANDPAKKHLLTTLWDDIALSRPGAKTFGLNGSRGCYAGWGGCVPRGTGGFTVYVPEHWAFADTDLYYGDVFGSDDKVFGYEVDGCDYTFKDGLPYATGADGAPSNLQILAMGVATFFEEDHGNPGSTFFIGPHDAVGVANALLRRSDPEAIDSVKRGSGMVAIFEKGKGTVFNAASCEWVAGLMTPDPFVHRITFNVLSRFTGRQ